MKIFGFWGLPAPHRIKGKREKNEEIVRNEVVN